MSNPWQTPGKLVPWCLIMTEKQIYQMLCAWYGGTISTQEQARALLLEYIDTTPVVLAELPDSLLNKLSILHDQEFTREEMALARAVKGRCERRILWAKP